MYQCPGCGGALKFDVATQNMKCDQCLNLIEPYSLEYKEGATQTFDATIFSCPHCGGEILSTDNSITEFCSFCGAHTVLESRLCSIKKPNYIIPFSITKEECKKIYMRHMRKSFFTPRAYKNEKCIESFRGIYMPYWAYHVEQKAPTELKGQKKYRRGDYIITDFYTLEFEIDAYYKGLSYDASSSFYDNISEAIGPYNIKNMKEFHPAILSGFYGDTMDIPSEVYCPDAFEYSNEMSFNAVHKVPEFRGLSITESNDHNVRNYTFDTRLAAIDSTMYPVWFMSYRNHNRIAYATINGQTGKITTDMPISTGKYILLSMLISIPVFLLFTLLFTFTAKTTLGIASILGMVSVIIYSNEIKAIAKNDSFADDKGMMHSRGRRSGVNVNNVQSQYKKGAKFVSKIIVAVVIAIIFFSIGLPVIEMLSQNIPLGTITNLISIVVTSIFLGNTSNNCKKLKQKFNPAIHVLNIIVYSLSLLIAIVNPVSDIIYYVAVIVMLLILVGTNISIINKRNIRATRKLPQFNKTGGNNSVFD